MANVVTSVASWVDLWMDIVGFKVAIALVVSRELQHQGSTFEVRWFGNRSIHLYARWWVNTRAEIEVTFYGHT